MDKKDMIEYRARRRQEQKTARLNNMHPSLVERFRTHERLEGDDNTRLQTLLDVFDDCIKRGLI